MAKPRKPWHVRVGKFLDNVIGALAPERQVKRNAARKALEVQQRFIGRARRRATPHPQASTSTYGGASSARTAGEYRVAGSQNTDLSADAALLPYDLYTLRSRSREMIRDDAIAASLVRVITDNAVGQGLKPQSRVDPEALGISETQAQDYQGAAERAWKRAIPWLDSTLETTVYGLQRLLCRKIVEDGEGWAVPLMIQEPNRPIESAVEIIEADRVDSPVGTPVSSRERCGVVLGKRGQPVAYWIHVAHPGDGMFYDASGRRRMRRIPRWDAEGRRQVYHVHTKLRPGQTRGVPMLAPVLDDLNDLSQYVEAEKVAARVSACFAAFVTKADPYGSAQAHLDTDTIPNSDRLEALEPGMIEYLSDGESITFGDPKRPHTAFPQYVDHAIRRIGAALGLPLELVLCDWSKVNYTSGRMATLEALRMFRAMRSIIVEKFCVPLWEWVLEEAYLKGELPGAGKDWLRRRDLWCMANWVEPARGWIDPQKDVNSSLAAIAARLSTRAEECAAQGRDWQEVIDQSLREELYEKEQRELLGLSGSSAVPDPEEEEQADEDEFEVDVELEDEGAEETVPDESEVPIPSEG